MVYFKKKKDIAQKTDTFFPRLVSEYKLLANNQVLDSYIKNIELLDFIKLKFIPNHIGLTKQKDVKGDTASGIKKNYSLINIES